VSLEAESQQIVQDPARRTTAATVSGYLAALAIFMSVIGIFWHPLRLIVPSLAIALIASGMAGPNRRLQQASVMIGAVCLFLGMALAVATSHALW
jgi:multisubunit Na+/H+ antiporter MnhG subunit